MKKHRYLVKRDGLYFAVVPVPARLKGMLRRKQIWRSLKTKSYAEAIVSLKIKVSVIMSFFEMWANHEGKEALAERHFADISMKCMVQLLKEDQEQRIRYSEAPNSESLLASQKQKDILQLELYKNDLAIGNYKVSSDTAVRYLARTGLVWDDRSLVYKNLCMEVLKKLVLGYEKILKRYVGIWDEDYITQYPQPDLFNTQLNNTIKEYRARLQSVREHKEKEVDEAKISKALEKFTCQLPSNISTKKAILGKLVDEFNNSAEIQQRSKAVQIKYQSYQLLLLQCLGEKIDISKIDRKDFRNLLSTLKQTPTNLNKLKEFRGLNTHEVIKKAAEGGYRLLSTSSINDYLEHLQTLLKWAKREGYNVVDDFSDIRAKREVKAKFERLPFSEDAIEKIILSQDIQKSKTSKDKTLYWTTMLAFLTGMRIGEICQLKLNDIRQYDGIDYISVNVEGNKSLKTEQSIRDIPINNILKKAGFMEYIESIRSKYPENTSIFPHYEIGASRAGDPISKRFTRLLTNLKIKSNKHTFHSTRHNYRDFIRESEFTYDEIGIALELCGWTTDAGSVHSNYGSGVSLKKKLVVVNKIKFGILESLF